MLADAFDGGEAYNQRWSRDAEPKSAHGGFSRKLLNIL
jgi:hypothetical protein